MGIDRIKLAHTTVGLFIQLPMWYYLIYQILKGVNASELTWFIFWMYMPLNILSMLTGRWFLDKPKTEKEEECNYPPGEKA